MRTLLCALVFFLCSNYCFAQHVYQIRADTVRIYNTCDTAELVLENRTKDTLGFLFNKGNGRTEFRKLKLISVGNKSIAIEGQDTLELGTIVKVAVDTIYRSNDTLFYRKTDGQVVSVNLGYISYGNNTYALKTRTLTMTGGTGISVSPGAAQDLSANRSWTITNTGVTSINGATGAVTVAPASGSGNYIQNQNASPQSANFNISGFGSLLSIGTLAGTGVSGVAHSYFKTTGGILRFVFGLQNIESSGNAGSDFKLWRYNDDGSFLGTVFTVARSTGVLDFWATPTSAGNTIWHAGNHAAGSTFTPTLTGANVLSTLTTNAAGHLTALTTRAMTAADIAAAPASGSGNYIQNQYTSVQTGNLWIDGIARTQGGRFLVQKDGSNTINPTFQLINAANAMGANLQLTGDATPGLAAWVHDGTNWVERMRITATGGVGMGTTAPSFDGLHVVRNISTITSQSTVAYSTTSGGYFAAYNSGTPSAANQRLGSLLFGSVPTGTTVRPSVQIDGFSDAAWTDNVSHPSHLRFLTTIAGANNPAERMRITSTGNVGIGTTAPGNPLHVTKTANVTPGTLSTYSVRITQSSADLGIGGDSSNNYIQSFNSKPLHINNQGNHVVFGVNSLSGVGIGVTPNFGLHVSKSGVQSGSVAIQNTDALSASSGGFVRIYNSGTPSASNQRLGGILLGTNPTGTTNRTGAQMEAYSESAWTDGSSHPTYLKFLTCPSGTAALAERMRITAAGNVGIGTTAPANTLHVVGTTRVTGVADLGNTSLIRGGNIDAANTSYLRFTESDGTTRSGYVGDGSSGNRDIYLTADSGSVRLVPSNGTSGNLNVQGTSMDYNGGQLFLNNGTANLINMNSVGVAAPAFTTRSAGTKIVLYPGISSTAVDYAIGIANSTMWFSLPQRSSGNSFKWYADTAQIARLDGTGNLTLNGQVQATSFFQSSLRSLKKDIQPFTQSALQVFEKVQVRTFKFKADSTGKTNIGFIADEVPDQMATPKRNGVDQASTVALLVKAVQELMEQNKALQQRVNTLELQMKEKAVQK